MLSQRQKKPKGLYSYCSAPQYDVLLHCAKDKNCFAKWHNAEYHKKMKK